MSLPYIPLIDSVDGAVLFTYTDSLSQDDEDFAPSAEIPEATPEHRRTRERSETRHRRRSNALHDATD